MAYEIRIFGSPVQLGAYSFFDLMDALPAARPVKAEVLDFQTASATTQPTFNTEPVKSAA